MQGQPHLILACAAGRLQLGLRQQQLCQLRRTCAAAAAGLPGTHAAATSAVRAAAHIHAARHRQLLSPGRRLWRTCCSGLLQPGEPHCCPLIRHMQHMYIFISGVWLILYSIPKQCTDRKLCLLTILHSKQRHVLIPEVISHFGGEHCMRKGQCVPPIAQ